MDTVELRTKMSKRILLWAYLKGYQQHLWPRWLRRLIVGTELHRAWLSGHMGVFEPGGSVCAREWYTREREIQDEEHFVRARPV